MTNVPDSIRDMWKDLYVLFDKHYLIPNTEEAWTGFWNEAKAIVDKYKDNTKRIIEFLVVVSAMIEDRQKQQMLKGE